MTREAMQMALEAFDNLAHYADLCEQFLKETHPGKSTALRERVTKAIPAITALRQALEQPADEPVAWDGYDLDAMVEAFERVIEAHFNRKNPFHNPIDADAQMALRVLRGFIPYMKSYTRPQPAAQWVEVECPLCGDMAVAHTQLPWHLNLSKSNKSGDEK